MDVKISDGAGDSFFDKLSEMRRAADSLAESAKQAPLAAKQQMLSSLLKYCEMLNSMLYTAGSWNTLMKAYATGKALSLTDGPSLKDLRKVIGELNAALGTLEPADMADEGEDGEHRDGLPLVMKLGDGSSPAGGGEAAAVAPAAVDISV